MTEELVQRAALLMLEGRVSARVRNLRWLDTFVRRMAARVLAAEPSRSASMDEFSDPRNARPANSPDEAVRSILDRLPARMRRALELRYLTADPTHRCASAMGLTAPAFRQLCRRAILKARDSEPNFLSHSWE